ncbi:MAG TPA: amidohydrolase family protein, partial [Beijerinckiaceae bacterium]|nr:amidohydrolase family protein [Beijerinckiaceae bacterium]
RIGVAPHSLRAVTGDELTALAGVFRAGPIHIHVAEQIREVEESLAFSGRRPVEWLLDHAEVDGRWCLIHATHMTEAETLAVATSGAVAGLCPITEANLGDGLFPAPEFLAAGGRFGVGSDSNVEIGAAAELRLLEYGQRLSRRGRNLLADREGQSTGEALYRAALAGGAQALGQPVGALAPGCHADLVVLDVRHPALAALDAADWLDGYIFAGGAAAIDKVVVRGQLVVDGGRHVHRSAVAARFAERMRRLQ